jgi:hypothetical protein
MRRESVDAGMPNAAAARVKLRVFATFTKSAKSARKRIRFFPVVHIRSGAFVRAAVDTSPAK